MAGEDFGRTPGSDGEVPVRCSFCGKTQDQVRKLVRGHDGMFICDECVEACNEILEQSFAQDEMMRAFGAAYAAHGQVCAVAGAVCGGHVHRCVRQGIEGASVA